MKNITNFYDVTADFFNYNEKITSAILLELSEKLKQSEIDNAIEEIADVKIIINQLKNIYKTKINNSKKLNDYNTTIEIIKNIEILSDTIIKTKTIQ